MAEEKNEKSAEEKLREDRLNNLESLSIYAGSRYLKSEENSFGSEGVKSGTQGYSQFIQGDKSKEIADKVYENKVNEMKNLGTVAMPERASNYEVEAAAIGMIQDAQARLSLEDLVGKVKKVNPNLKFEVAEGFKGKNAADIYKKLQEAQMKGEEYKPSEEEQGVLAYHDTLSKAYEKASAFNLIASTYMSDFEQMGNNLEKRFAPKEESKDSKKSE